MPKSATKVDEKRVFFDELHCKRRLNTITVSNEKAYYYYDDDEEEDGKVNFKSIHHFCDAFWMKNIHTRYLSPVQPYTPTHTSNSTNTYSATYRYPLLLTSIYNRERERERERKRERVRM